MAQDVGVLTEGSSPGAATPGETAFAARHERVVLAAILAGGLLVRLPFASRDQGVIGDIFTISAWAHAIAAHGFVAFTDTVTATVYPPLSMLIIGAAGAVSSIAPPGSAASDALLVFLLKLGPILADLGLALLVAHMLRERSARVRLGAAALICFNPVFWYLSAVWGQLDSIWVFFSVAAVYALSFGASNRGWLAFGLAVASKIQPLALAPLMVLVTLRDRGPRRLAIGVAIALALLVALSIPWLLGGGMATYLHQVWGTPPQLDVSAANIWYLLRGGAVSRLAVVGWRPLGLPIDAGTIGVALLALVVVAVCAALWWRRSAVGLALPAAILFMAPFMLLPGMRERYLLGALPFVLLVAVGWNVRVSTLGAWLAFGTLTLTLSVNLLAAAPPDRSLWTSIFLRGAAGPAVPFMRNLVLLAAAVNVVVFAWLVATLIRVGLLPGRRSAAVARESASSPG